MPDSPVTVVLAAYHEAETLPKSVPWLFGQLPHGSEILIAVNEEPDGPTFPVAEDLAAQYPGVVRALRCSGRGIGAAWREGFLEARHDRVVLSAADVPFGVSDLQGWERTGAAVVIGSKGHPDSTFERGLARVAVSALLAGMRRALLGQRVRDPQGTWLIDRAAVPAFSDAARQDPRWVDGWLVGVGLAEIARASGVTPVEVPVQSGPFTRPSKVSPKAVARSGMQMLRISVTWRSMQQR